MKADMPNPKVVLMSERLDLIQIRFMDKIIDYCTAKLPMDMEAFFAFFQKHYSLKKTYFTITLAQFIQTYIDYIEYEHKERKQEGASRPVVPNLISQKLELHQKQILEIFKELSPHEPTRPSLGKVREFWQKFSTLSSCVMVKAGTAHVPGEKFIDDPECLNMLHEHICLAHFLS